MPTEQGVSCAPFGPTNRSAPSTSPHRTLLGASSPASTHEATPSTSRPAGAAPTGHRARRAGVETRGCSARAVHRTKDTVRRWRTRTRRDAALGDGVRAAARSGSASRTSVGSWSAKRRDGLVSEVPPSARHLRHDRVRRVGDADQPQDDEPDPLVRGRQQDLPPITSPTYRLSVRRPPQESRWYRRTGPSSRRPHVAGAPGQRRSAARRASWRCLDSSPVPGRP